MVGPAAESKRVVQACAKGHAVGRCRIRRRPVEAIRPGTLMIRARSVAHRALAMPVATSGGAGEVERASQAALAAYFARAGALVARL